LIITRATEYAIRAVLFLSKHPKGEIVLKKDICRTQQVTPAFLTKILQPLIKNGIVGSQRGVGGGFFLLKEPADISLLDIVEAEEGQLFLNHCLVREGTCDRDIFCPVHGAWKQVRDDFVATLKKYSFADLIQQEEANLSDLRSRGITGFSECLSAGR